MILAPPTLLALSEACAPAVAPTTLLALVRAESGGDPNAIGVNRGGRPAARAAGLLAAERIARARLARGGDLDLGLAQINSRNLSWLGLSVREALDPCQNLAAGARILTANYARARQSARDDEAALRTALSLYNTGDPTRGFANGYVQRVTRAAAQMVPALAPGAAAAGVSAAGGAPATPSIDVFSPGADRAPFVF